MQSVRGGVQGVERRSARRLPLVRALLRQHAHPRPLDVAAREVHRASDVDRRGRQLRGADDVAVFVGRLQALRACRLSRSVSGRLDHPHRIRRRLRAARHLQRLRLLRRHLPLRRGRPPPRRRPRVQVHVLLRPPEGRRGAGLREGGPDAVDSLRRPRRARARRRGAAGEAACLGDDGRLDLESERQLRRRHARLLPRARRRAAIQPATGSGGADDAAQAGVERCRRRCGSDRGRRAVRVRARSRVIPSVSEGPGREGREKVTSSPLPPSQTPRSARDDTPTYHELPLLKPPVWTWEVPAYFFVGGAAGAAAVLGAAAQLAGPKNEKLVRDARWIAAIGAALSGPLLVSDLGRPERFLNMLRVFKPQSPMSVGAWTLAVFGAGSTAAVFLPSKTLRNALAAVAAASGLGMSTYTGVLIGATTVPVWKEHVDVLPVHFGASALGSAVSLLELRGHRSDALNALGLGASKRW